MGVATIRKTKRPIPTRKEEGQRDRTGSRSRVELAVAQVPRVEAAAAVVSTTWSSMVVAKEPDQRNGLV